MHGALGRVRSLLPFLILGSHALAQGQEGVVPVGGKPSGGIALAGDRGFILTDAIEFHVRSDGEFAIRDKASLPDNDQPPGGFPVVFVDDWLFLAHPPSVTIYRVIADRIDRRKPRAR